MPTSTPFTFQIKTAKRIAAGAAMRISPSSVLFISQATDMLRRGSQKVPQSAVMAADIPRSLTKWILKLASLLLLAGMYIDWSTEK